MNACNCCGAELTAENWFPSFRSTNNYRCKSCHKTHTLESRQRRKQQSPIKWMLKEVEYRAKKKGIPFDLTEKDIVIPEVCPILGIPLVFNEGHGKDNSPSLDRFIPELGYVKGNVAVISYRANTIKSSATLQEVAAVLHWMQSVAQSE